jgi:hypothetical protein
MAPPRIDPISRILSRIDYRGTCWIYTGSRSGDGYGVIGIGKKSFRVHRVMFEEYVRTLVDKEIVCHTCDTPLCCNPEHLFAGSHSDNAIDRENKGRANRPFGEKHGNSKISNAQRNEIIARRKSGETLKSIASDYGIAFQHVALVCKKEKLYAAGN